MSRFLTRLGDLSAGHGCWPPRPNITASPNVFTNSIPNHRQTDYWPTHCCGNSCHDGFLLVGSPTVYTNSLQQSRTGDPISCGDYALIGSPNTFVGP